MADACRLGCVTGRCYYFAMVVYCEESKETFDATKGRQLLDQLSDCKHLRIDFLYAVNEHQGQ